MKEKTGVCCLNGMKRGFMFLYGFLDDGICSNVFREENVVRVFWIVYL